MKKILDGIDSAKAAKIIGCTPQWVWELTKAKKLVFEMLGGRHTLRVSKASAVYYRDHKPPKGRPRKTKTDKSK